MPRNLLQSFMEEHGHFSDSRDGEMDALRATVSNDFGVHLNPTNRMAPVGNIVDSTRLTQSVTGLRNDMTPEQLRRVPDAVFNPGIYSDMVQLFVPVPASTSVMALPRPGNTRIFLLIQNTNINNLFVAFDQIASASSLMIPPGGNILFDAAVPQNDIHIAYGAAVDTLVPIFYMNADLARAVA